jgi:hypothetical protein
MRYKSIVLDLLQDQYPTLHEHLRRERRLLAALDQYAIGLKNSHEEWKERLDQAKPGRDPSQMASEALELAIETLRDRLSSASPPEETEPLSLDAAMSYIRRHTPPA